MKGANGQLPKPRPDVRLYLFHGSDEAGAGDLARQLVAAIGAGERVDLDGTALRREPGRLADEAASVSLFGDARVIRAQPIGEESLEALTLLLDASQAAAPVVAHAPNVRATARIVKLVNDHPRALGIACYPLGPDQLDRLVTGLLAAQGLRPAPGVAHHLSEASGGDRAVIAREIDKLALYLDAAPDRPRDTTLDDLAAIGADLGEAEQAGAAAALIRGDAAALGTALTALDDGGASAIPWLRAMDRQLIGASEPAGQGRRLFGEQAALAQALARWTPAMTTDALARLHAAQRAQLTPANAGAVTAEHIAVLLARAVDRRR